jgi:hypothetical protein
MASSSDSIFNIQSGRLAVGLSGIFGLSLVPGQQQVIVSYVSGSSLCEIGGASLTWGQGYIIPLIANSPLVINTTGTVYFATAGATTVIQYIKGVSAGT